MPNKKTFDAKQAHLWIVGGGIAGMAAAAFAIRDAQVPAQNIHILEELNITGVKVRYVDKRKDKAKKVVKLVEKLMEGAPLLPFLVNI